ncbi:PadR family transcriptional regulator [Alkalibacterium olivapovliticus]|uniref:PadR family transcriptional regulator PadR n=1 Tax=Alkalibacterium olivapovliticus TaxID=99907 RepID=A0A2T0W768_9LACT|nr:PadR family transcriptional regulator [Alkalibacterium olivapovliticus]PRY82529.1 PadR family transcriptional regulator PadR [Alkalibacterium olivapovliticus]
MISSDVIRGYNDSFLLSLLNEGDSYGYALSKDIKERTGGQYLIKETTMYSAFSRLKKNGYIESYPGDVTQGKKRTYYRITSEGKQFLEEKQKEWQITKQVVDQLVGGEKK